MKRRGSMMRLWSTVALVVMMALVASPVFAGTGPWQGQVRPGVSYGGSDTQVDFNLDMLFPVWGTDRNLLFLNVNGRLSDDGEDEQNVGIGYRGLYRNGSWIFGGNLFYDSMYSQYDKRYHQLGLGLEALSQSVDFRTNFYLPISSTKQRVKSYDAYEFGSSALLVNKGYEEALTGADAEVGVLIPWISNVVETRAFAGGYWYDSDVRDDFFGWRLRGELRPAKAVNLNVEVRDDEVRGTDAFIGAYLDIPFSVGNLFSGKNPFEGFHEAFAFGKGTRSLKERMVEKVIRDRHVATIVDTADKTEKYADIIYVNQDNGETQIVEPTFATLEVSNGYCNGMGTLEDPYACLEEVPYDNMEGRLGRYKPGTIVYVFSWDEEPDTYYTRVGWLLDDMVLWGQGYYHPVFKLGGFDKQSDMWRNPIICGGGLCERIIEPDISGPSISLLNFNGYSCDNGVICLADNNEIMGLTLLGGPHGIYGGNGINDSFVEREINGDHLVKRTYIHDNIIALNFIENSGIHIENYMNAEDVNGQTLSYRFDNNWIVFNQGSGIYLRNKIKDEDSISDLSINSSFANNRILLNLGYEGFPFIFEGFSEGFPKGGESLIILQQNGDNGEAECGTGDGICVETMLSGLSGYDRININNTFTGNFISMNFDDGIDVISLVSNEGGIRNSHIRNTFVDNTVGAGELTIPIPWFLESEEDTYTFEIPIGNFDDGIHAINAIEAYGALEDVSITNDFLDNTVERNTYLQGGQSGVHLENNIETFQDDAPITNAAISNTFMGGSYSYNFGYGIFIDNEINTNGTGSPIANAHISNQLLEVRADCNGFFACGEGEFPLFVEYDEKGGDGGPANLFINNDIKAWSEETNSPITNSSITNDIQEGSYSSSSGEGIKVENEINSSGEGDSITNARIANIINGLTAEENFFDNLFIDNVIGTYNDFAPVENASIENSVDESTFNGSIEGAGINIMSTIETDGHESGIGNASIQNSVGEDVEATGNNYENLLLRSYIQAGVCPSNSPVTNASISNTVEGGNYSGARYTSGIYIENFIVTQDEGDTITDAGITNTIRDAVVTDNGYVGINLRNFINAYSDSVDRALISNSVVNNMISENGHHQGEGGLFVENGIQANYNVTSSSISDTVSDNTINENYGSAGAKLSYGDQEGVHTQILFNGNTVADNYYGLWVLHPVNGTFSANYGSGNSFGVSYFDIYSEVDDPSIVIPATGNTWGTEERIYDYDWDDGLADVQP